MGELMHVTQREFHAALALVWEELEGLQQSTTTMEGHMADITTALSDLDSLLGDFESEVAKLQTASGPAAVQAVADTLESKITAARAALNTAQSGSGGTPVPPVTPPAGGGTPTT